MSRVGEPTWEDAIIEGLCDRIRDHHATEWHVAGVDTLRKGDEVRLHRGELIPEPIPSPTESTHHLIGNPKDPVLVTERSDTFQISLRWNQYSCCPYDRLDEDRSDCLRSFEDDDILEMLECALTLFLFTLRPEGSAIEIRTEEVDVPIGELIRPTTWIPGRSDRTRGVAVIGTIEAEDLVTTSVDTCHLDRVLDCIGATIGEEDLVMCLPCY